MDPVRWGVLSTARIGLKKVIPGMQKSDALVVAAIASRDPDRARAAAEAAGIPQAFGSYEALLADPGIEAIYNPLPNDQHVPWTLAAARAGKHVLCEKPMALAAADLEALRPYAGRVHLGEAFMVRHHPQWLGARERVRTGAIGDVRFMQVAFAYYNADPANIRNDAGAGGGALYDIGCYAVLAGRWFFESEPLRVVASVDTDPGFGTDRCTSALLDFGLGRQLVFSVSTQAGPFQRLTIVGSRGRLEMALPFNPPPDHACIVTLDGGDAPSQVRFEAVDQYRLQAEAFSRAIRTAAPDATALDDAVRNMRTIDALFRSARTGRFEAP